MELTILPELQSFLAEVPAALTGLETRLVANKRPRDKIVAWAHGEQLIILDGHRRYAICQKHGLPFDVETLDDATIPDILAAKRWIWDNQNDRRNWTPKQRAFASAALLKLLKERGRTASHRVNTAREAAATIGVSKDTILRDQKYVAAYRSLAPEVRKLVDGLTPPLTIRDLVELASLPPEHQKNVFAVAKDFPNFHEALMGVPDPDDPDNDSDEETISATEADIGAVPDGKDAATAISDAGIQGDSFLGDPAAGIADPKMFDEAAKRLGAFERFIVKLGEAFPGPRCVEMAGLFNQMSAALGSWRKEEA